MMLELYEVAAITAAAATAARQGLLAALYEADASADELAARTGCDAAAAALVLDVLVAAGPLERRGARYAFTATARTSLGISPGGLPRLIELFAHAPRFVATGEPTARMDGTPAERAAAYTRTAGELGDFFASHAEALAAAVPPARGSILDVGAGSGVWSLALAARTPDARVVAIDFAEVLPRFHERAARLGLGARAESRAGRWQDTAFGTGHDRVVLANILHLEDEAGAAALIQRAAAALADGGALLIVDVLDVLAGDDTRARLGHAAYQLHLGMRTRTGRAHRHARLVSWLADAGLRAAAPIALPGPAGRLSALVAARG